MILTSLVSPPVTPPSSILFDYSVMGEKKADGGGRADDQGKETERKKERDRERDRRDKRKVQEVGRYKW